MFKRFMAGMMAMIIMLGALAQAEAVFGYIAENSVNDLKTISDSSIGIEEPQNGFSVKGTNSFGHLLADKISVATAEQIENNGCNIFSVEMDGQVASVSFETTEDAVLVIGIYDELGVHMVSSTDVEVSAGDTYVQVTVEGDMPQYFYVQGFLVDSESMRPLCTAYESSMYTQEMQEFLAKTTEDFEQDKVLNLDHDISNNFAVFNDEITIIPEKDGGNTVVKADEENHIYVIENAGSELKGLQPGDTFSCQYGDHDFLIVKAASIEIDGDTVTITGADALMEDIFDYVKIDTASSTADAEVDMSGLDGGIEYEGMVEYEDDEQAHLNALDIDEHNSWALSYKIEKINGKVI